ncbi:hypothetical protein HHK36_027385 [Tetracentron sinense]|uniref:Transcription factor IIIC 90kDa subunit N-terminal domain-containing protein n=1 Tax=Tetracentron sinense TaxID=13715 RepID=A0A834YJ21_TETSI|nr:hypothetical protein HHK36_027385 [Tetracentron sinense]
MASRFQAAALVASPSYPNSVAWSDENLVAVASGHLVTILNPALPFGPRGLITIPPSTPFSIGVIKREDLLAGCLMPTCLSRELRPCARSISWSQPGFAPNSGCLLAVCTTEGRVKLYRPPFCEFRAEWVEVTDISDMLQDYLSSINFGELDMPSRNSFEEQTTEHGMEPECAEDLHNTILRKGRKRRKASILSKIIKDTGNLEDQLLYGGNRENANGGCTQRNEKIVTTCTEVACFSSSIFKQGSSVEVFRQNGSQRFWVSGVVECADGAKAHVLFPETVENGKQDEWIELKPNSNKIKESSVLYSTTADQDTHFPKVRPSMNVGKLPKQIILAECHGADEILRIGQAVEAWTNDRSNEKGLYCSVLFVVFTSILRFSCSVFKASRWVEGWLMGFNESSLLVELYGDSGCVTLDPSSVRLAPLWASERNSWQVTCVKIDLDDREFPEVVDIKSERLSETNLHQIVSAPKSEGKPLKKRRENGTLPLITAEQYASRSAMLSSLVVAWSPVLQLSSENGPKPPNNSSNNCALLAVGGKSGKISFWKIHEPQSYSVEHDRVSVDVMLVGLLQAHNTWITTITWGLFVSDASNPRVVLATGCSDGSVKIWLGYTEGLCKSSEITHASFSLLKEVKTVASAPVSVLSLTVPVESVHKMVLAIGKGSGSLEVWICDISSCEFYNAGSYDAHDHVVTGLAWAFDRCCLYSCSQDNSVRSWILHGSSLIEVPIPSNTPGLKSSTDLPHVFDSCFGLAVSPGNLVIAVARSFDADLLNPMYQARTQKAAVEFLWIGGQQVEVLSDRYPEFGSGTFTGLSEREMGCWESNILWSLKQYDNVDKPLVLWDVIAALSAFKQSTPNYVDRILVKWLSSWGVCCHMGITEKTMFHAPNFLAKIGSRQLHLLNIICRRVVLSDLKTDIVDSRLHKLGGVYGVEDDQLNLWTELLISSERELRQRLVAFSFAAVLSLMSCSATNVPRLGYWLPGGVAQIEQWVAINHDRVKDQIKLLESEVGKLGERLHSFCEYVVKEQCSFCSASVPFESPEFAFCEGVKCNSGVGQNHKLARCAVSMQVCPTAPLWFCVCCQRRASKLAPHTLFIMSNFPLDLKSLTESSALCISSKPLCPFCGILLQRLQPEFLLSASPV